MKNFAFGLLFTIAFCFSFEHSNAQYVTIPDPDFVLWLNDPCNGFSACMGGNSLDTTCSDIISATSFYLGSWNINDITGIQYFVNLKSLDCSGNPIWFLPLISDSIEWLNVSSTDIFGLSHWPSKLISFKCDLAWNFGNGLPSLLPNSLKYLSCMGVNLYSLPVLPPGLLKLSCSQCELNSLPVLPDSLIELNCYENYLTSLPDLTPTLVNLNCGRNQLITLPILPQSLKILECSLDTVLSQFPNLPDSLDFLDLHGDINLTCLPGIQWIQSLDWQNTSIQCLPNAINIGASAIPSLLNVPICNLFNFNHCRPYRNIQGTIFSDNNADCALNNGETHLKNIKLKMTQNGFLIQQTISNLDGRYFIYIDSGTVVINVDTSGAPYIVNCPIIGNYSFYFPSGNTIYTGQDFSVQCKPGFDVGINSIVADSGRIRPANYARINITGGDLSGLYNLHCASGISGLVTVVINGPAVYTNAIPGSLIPIVIGDTLIYSIVDFGTLNFQHDLSFIIKTNVAAQIGQQVCFDVKVTPLAGDNNLSNNFYSHCFNVVNSYDPNEKEVSPSGATDTSQQWLTYTIHFQNTGNAPAQQIYINDTLDNNIDESSIQLLAYSHEPVVQVFGKIVRFNFPNINLPDSLNDEPRSHGYVQYKVKRKDNLPLGTQIKNTAYIYFDFNAPVQTNTTVNTLTVPVAVTELRTLKIAFSIYPNPLSGNILNI